MAVGGATFLGVDSQSNTLESRFNGWRDVMSSVFNSLVTPSSQAEEMSAFIPATPLLRLRMKHLVTIVARVATELTPIRVKNNLVLACKNSRVRWKHDDMMMSTLIAL